MRGGGAREPPAVAVLHLLPAERRALLSLLTTLTPAGWALPTACPGWSVKDVAVHLLGDDVGRLSVWRDRHPFLPIGARPTWEELVTALNRSNQQWVEAVRRISPRLLVELLAFSGASTQAYFRSLDLGAAGPAVSWAGPGPAPVWLDVAREYTERWLHQQHVRDAVGRPGLKERRFLTPVLATFVRALPHAYRDIEAGAGTTLQVRDP